MSVFTPILVTAVRFTEAFDAIPTRIELNGITYRLGNDYKKVTLESEEGTSSIFDLSDDTHRFRLREDMFHWRLISMSSRNA
jgi:hypothetical protein